MAATHDRIAAAFRRAPELKSLLLCDAQETGRNLGIGSYGSVMELRVGATLCAGKKLHEALIDLESAGAERMVSSFLEECKLMSELRHPRIAQFLGVCLLPSSSVPILVTELMGDSLRGVIEKRKSLPLTIKQSILTDVAVALVYLHSRAPPVIHRDLTAQNVLIDLMSMKAKITDLGNSRFIDVTAARHGRTMTRIPGTLEYMPPEALEEHANYSDKLDIFSFGHLALYTITQVFPKRLLSHNRWNPDTDVLIPLTEVQRRDRYMALLYDGLGEEHALVKLIQQCLHNSPKRRPTAMETLQWLEDSNYLVPDVHTSRRDYEDITIFTSQPPGKEDDFKNGPLEKLSKKKWKWYTFKILNGTHLKYFKSEKKVPQGEIALYTVTDVKTLEHNERFSFEVHFKGKDSPWILATNSASERMSWMEAIRSKHEEPRVRPRCVYGLDYGGAGQVEKHTQVSLAPPTGRILRAKTPEPLMDHDHSQPLAHSRSSQNIYQPHYDDPVVLTSSRPPFDKTGYEPISIIPPPLPPKGKARPPDTGRPRPRNIVYECMPAIYLQKPTLSGNPPPAIHNIPPSPSTSPPLYTVLKPRFPKPAQDLAIDVYPEENEHDGTNESGKDAYPDAFTQRSVYEEMDGPLHSLALQAHEQRKRTPSYGQEYRTPSKHEGTRSNAHEELLITGGGPLPYEVRPTWAIAKQDAVPLPSTSLESLHKDTLYISESSLSNVTKIGEGKFGEVYKANMRSIIVAVKVTKRFSSEKAIRDFQNEMSILSEVVHPNIVRLYGIIREGRISPALVMEFLPHGDLLTFLKKKKPANSSMLKYMRDVAMGMHYLGERGLVHRDLAARNVLVDMDEICKVSDFGLLREIPKNYSIYVSEDHGPSPLRWMAPESIASKVFSPATDIWSYGVLLWEMFNPDKVPYKSFENTGMIVKVANGYRMPIPRSCPSLVANIMKACWQHNPGSRPSFLLITHLLTQQLIA